MENFENFDKVSLDMCLFGAKHALRCWKETPARFPESKTLYLAMARNWMIRADCIRNGKPYPDFNVTPPPAASYR